IASCEADAPCASEFARQGATIPMNPDDKEQPLTPALYPYERERVNRSLVLEHASGLDSRCLQVQEFNVRASVRRNLTQIFRTVLLLLAGAGAAFSTPLQRYEFTHPAMATLFTIIVFCVEQA